jgi:hypothetical protein
MSLIALFVVGPLFGMAALHFAEQSLNGPSGVRAVFDFALQQASMFLAAVTMSMMLGSGVLVLSVPMILVAVYVYYCDGESLFAQMVLASYHRLFAAFQRIGSAMQNGAQRASEFRRSSYAKEAVAKESVSESVETINRVVPVICPRTSVSEQELLQALVVKIAQLQQWAARPESDRVAVAELTSQARKLEEALNEAVLKLDTGTTNWKEICSHIEGLSRHQLPSELSSALDALVQQRKDQLVDTRTDVADLSDKLRTTTGELKQKLATPVLSPEEVISSADVTLQSAEEVSSKSQQ